MSNVRCWISTVRCYVTRLSGARYLMLGANFNWCWISTVRCYVARLSGAKYLMLGANFNRCWISTVRCKVYNIHQMNGNSRLVEQVYRLILETFDDYGRTDRGGIWWCDDVLSRHHRFSQHILCLYFLRPSLTRRIWNLFCLVEYISIRHRFHSNRCPSTTLFLFSSQGRLLWIYKFCLCTWKEM